MINKIIINGRAGSGKDTVADYLVHKYGFIKVSFAKPIYDIAREYFGMMEKNRTLLQHIGESFREFDPDVWVKYLFKTILRRYGGQEKIVIPDCRRENEYNEAIKNGFFPIRVSSDIQTRIKRTRKRDGIKPDILLWEKETETGADKLSFLELPNYGTIQELYEAIDFMMDNITG